MEISKILNGNYDYHEGVEFYNKHGKSQVLKELFKSGKNSFTIKKLHEELKFIASGLTDKKLNNLANDSKDPKEIHDMRLRWAKLYKECAHHHAQLRILTTDEERRNNATFIVNTMSIVEKIWNVVDTYDNTGQVILFNPITKDTFEDKNNVELILLRNKKRVLQSKLKGKLERGGSLKKMSEWQDKLIITTQELSEINNLLDGKIICT